MDPFPVFLAQRALKLSRIRPIREWKWRVVLFRRRRRKRMSIQGISQASGADLLSLYGQGTGSGAAASTNSASAAVLQTAIAMAQMSEAQLVGQPSAGSTTGSQLNVYA